MPRLSLVTIVVADYDEALAFYVGRLGFHVLEDTQLDTAKRWVVVRPPGAGGTSLLLARAATGAQRAAIGNQTGGRVAFFLETEDFPTDYARLLAAGVHFVEDPRDEAYGTVAVFEDLYGNRWDLLAPRRR